MKTSARSHACLGGRYRQVLLAFARRRCNVLIAVVAVVSLAVLLLHREPHSPSEDSRFRDVLSFLTLLFGLSMAGHIQELFSVAETKLVPQFVTTHVLAMVVMATGLLIAAPAALAACLGHSPIAAVSSALLYSSVGSLLVARAFLGCVLTHAFLLLCVAAVLYSPGTAVLALEYLTSLGLGPGGTVARVLLGLAIHGAVLYHLAHLPERAEGGAHRRSALLAWARSLDGRFLRSPLDRLDGPAGGGLWARAKLRRMAIEASVGPRFLLSMVVIVFALRLIFSITERHPYPFIPIFAWQPIAFSSSVSTGLHLNREYLFPATRRAALREMALAAAMTAGRTWLISSSTETFLCALLDPASLGNPLFYGLLAASAPFQIIVVAPAALALSLFPWGGKIGVLILVGFPVCYLLALQQAPPRDLPIADYAAPAVVLLALGPALLWAARRRWMLCDIP